MDLGEDSEAESEVRELVYTSETERHKRQLIRHKSQLILEAFGLI